MPTEESREEALKRQLARLHAELSSAEAMDAETRAMLETLATDIERTLAGESDPDTIGEQIERLEEAALRFEVQHPKFSALMSTIMDSLQKFGV